MNWLPHSISRTACLNLECAAALNGVAILCFICFLHLPQNDVQEVAVFLCVCVAKAYLLCQSIFSNRIFVCCHSLLPLTGSVLGEVQF